MRSTSPFGSLLVLTAGDHSWKFLIVLSTLTRQDAFQHHLTIFIKHKLSSLIMSQPTQQQQGRTYFQEQEHVPRAHSGQGIGDGGLRYVFSSHLLWMDLAQPLGTAGAQGPHTACYCFLPQHRHSHSSDSCHTPYFLNCTVPSAILQEERTKSLATIQAVVLQKLQPKGLPPLSHFSWSRWRTGHLTTLGLTLRGEWKPMPTCFLALQMKLKQFEITMPHSVSKAAKHSLLSP